MEIKEKKQVLREVTIAHKCDNCGLVVQGEDIPANWHIFSSHSNDNPYESIDTYESYEVCSPECYSIILSEIVQEMESVNNGVIDGMEIQFARNLQHYLKR